MYENYENCADFEAINKLLYVFSERNCKQIFQIYDVFLEQRNNFLIKSESAIYFFVKRLILVLFFKFILGNTIIWPYYKQ